MGGRRLFAWDTFQSHLCDSVKRALSRKKIETVYIPGGCTSYIQALYICWNKQFKDYCTAAYNEWFMNEGLNNVTNAGNLHAPPRKEIVRWILAAWGQLTNELINNSFILCGLTTNDDQFHKINCFKKNRSCSDGLAMLGDAIGTAESSLRQSVCRSICPYSN